eukprot:13071400-Alexandrium_andersonii.AAC.1
MWRAPGLATLVGPCMWGAQHPGSPNSCRGVGGQEDGRAWAETSSSGEAWAWAASFWPASMARP